MEERVGKRKRTIRICAAAALCAAVIAVGLFLKKDDDVSATTIQVVRYVGGVTLSDASGGG